MPSTDADLGLGILIQSKNEAGYIMRGSSKGIGSALPTTASKFAVNAEMICTDGIFRNEGTVAVPSWNNIDLIDDNEEANPLYQQVVQVALTAAQINALFTTSIEVIPAIAGKNIILDDMVLDLTGTATQFTAGGVLALQYKDTANGGGVLLHADIAATVLTGATARILTQRVALVAGHSSVATADITGIGVYVGVQTQDFATGTGTAVLTVRYHTV